jgi:hypothetical protein
VNRKPSAGKGSDFWRELGLCGKVNTPCTSQGKILGYALWVPLLFLCAQASLEFTLCDQKAALQVSYNKMLHCKT